VYVDDGLLPNDFSLSLSLTHHFRQSEQPHKYKYNVMMGGNLLEKFRISSKNKQEDEEEMLITKNENMCALQYSYHFSLTSQDNFPTLILTFRHFSFFFPTKARAKMFLVFFFSSLSSPTLVHN
jgi:hypothetical protein